MQPLGREPKRHNFVDYQCEKGTVNWWEDLATENKKGERRKSKVLLGREYLDGHKNSNK